MDVGNLISDSSAFSKSSLYIWNFSAHILLKPSLKDFEHNLASMWNVCNCTVIWTFFGIAFFCDCNENWFSSLLATAEFSDFADILMVYLTASSFRIWKSSVGIPSLVLSLAMFPMIHLTSHSRMSGSRWVNTLLLRPLYIENKSLNFKLVLYN